MGERGGQREQRIHPEAREGNGQKQNNGGSVDLARQGQHYSLSSVDGKDGCSSFLPSLPSFIPPSSILFLPLFVATACHAVPNLLASPLSHVIKR